MEQVYIGLGSNLGDSFSLITEAQKRLEALGKAEHAPLYQTSPVSPIPQAPYINSVTRLYTDLNPHPLLWALEKIEKDLGKKPKAKEAPRFLDLDLLFYGDLKLDDPILELPHPRWKERLFVLIPLSHLTPTIGDLPLYPLIQPLIAEGEQSVALYKPTVLV